MVERTLQGALKPTPARGQSGDLVPFKFVGGAGGWEPLSEEN
jgi:hypothetical protein